MRGYSGHEPRPWRAVAFAAVLACLLGVGAGWLIFHGRSSSAAAPAGPCPGSQHDPVGRDQVAACLVGRYFALANSSGGQRNQQLAQLIRPGDLAQAQKNYQPLPATVASEYAAVAATKLTPNPDRPETDYQGDAWVAFVDSYKDGSPPRSQWFMTSFELQWQDGRWWLANSGVGLATDATPPATAPATGGFGYGPGWVAVGHA